MAKTAQRLSASGSIGALLTRLTCVLALSSAHFALSPQGSAAAAPAPSFVGSWQTSVDDRKHVLEISRQPDGNLHGELYHLGQEISGRTLNGNTISAINTDSPRLHFDLDYSAETFDGKLSADGSSLTGTFSAAGSTFPIEFQRASRNAAWTIDASPHKARFIPVAKDVRLEVLDWGGSGPPLVLLAGNGNTGHVYDDFALKLTGKHHVYGITRRGLGLSSRPAPTAENYDSDRLGDDVLAVIDALKLDRPVVAGHSLAGEELSSIGTRHPDRVAGLIYLDASYAYAFYSPNGDNLLTDLSTMQRDVRQMIEEWPYQARERIQAIQATLPLLQKGFDQLLEQQRGMPEVQPPSRVSLVDKIEAALNTGGRKYIATKVPVLAIVALPLACDTHCDDPEVKARTASQAAQTDAFEAATPTARVVRIPQAQHYVFLSNESQVLQEMNAFMDRLN